MVVTRAITMISRQLRKQVAAGTDYKLCKSPHHYRLEKSMIGISGEGPAYTLDSQELQLKLNSRTNTLPA